MEALMKQLLEMASDIETEVKKSVRDYRSAYKDLDSKFDGLKAAVVQIEGNMESIGKEKGEASENSEFENKTSSNFAISNLDETKSMGLEVDENFGEVIDGFNNFKEKCQQLESEDCEITAVPNEVSVLNCSPNIGVAASCQVCEARFDMIAEENDWDSVDKSQHLAGSLRAEADDVLTTISGDWRISCETEEQALPKDHYSVGNVAGQKDTEIMLEVVAGIARKLENIENAKKDGMIENSRGKDGIHETTGFAPSRMLLGRELNLPCDVIFGQSPDASSSPADYIDDLQERLEDVHDFTCIRIDIATRKIKARSDARATEYEFHGGEKVRSWKYRRKELSTKLPVSVLKGLNVVVIWCNTQDREL